MKCFLILILILILFLASAVIADSPDYEVQKEQRVELKDGTIFYGHEMSGEGSSDEYRIFQTRYGKLEVPAGKILSNRTPFENFVVYEEWKILNDEGKSEATISVDIGTTKSDSITLPLIESRYGVTTTKVTTLDGNEIRFEQLIRGPIVLLKLETGSNASGTKKVLVTLTADNSLTVSDTGEKKFSRRFIPKENGRAYVSLDVSPGLKISADKELENYRVMKTDENIRRQLPWIFEAAVLVEK